MGRFNSKMDLWVFFFITIALFAGYFGVVSGAASTGRVDSYVNSGMMNSTLSSLPITGMFLLD